MQKRKNITDLFTTFLQLDTDKVIGWATDRRLRRNILNSQARLSQVDYSEDFWVNYWYKKWEQNPKSLAKEHLLAYLQETCYWVVNKIVKNIYSVQYTLSDCFQMMIARIDKVLKGFKPQMGFSLKNYGSAILSSELNELLRQEQEINICSDWRLLRKLTQKRLVESLENLGMNSKIIERYILAWKCYQTLYTPTQRTGSCKLQKPEPQTWKAIAAFYNSQRLNQLSSDAPECSAEIIEQWMLTSAKAVRTYLYPKSVSLNAPKGDGEASRELIDDLPGYEQESPISQIVIQEELLQRKVLRDRISAVLVTAFQELDRESIKMIELYYGRELSQRKIAKELGIKQYTVSRRLTKAIDTLILKLASYCKESLHISLNAATLDYITTLMKEWLKIKDNWSGLTHGQGNYGHCDSTAFKQPQISS